MVKSRFFCGGSVLAVTLALSAAPAFAQQPASGAAPSQTEIDKCYEEAADDEAKLSECDARANAVTAVVSTGSRIRGLPEDAALPVETVTREDLLEKGSPTVLDLMRSLSEIGAVQGESNRGATGYGNNSVNLRSLGSGRTLALINGRRLGDAPNEAAVTAGNFQDVSVVPAAALQQVEILKDGGTTTYGADAVAGVVNFITRRDLNGMEVTAAYRFLDGSDGDPELSVLWGRRNEGGNLLLGFTYTGRGELKCMEREWCLKEPFRTDQKEITGNLTTANANPGAFQVQLPGSSLASGGFTGAQGFTSIQASSAAPGQSTLGRGLFQYVGSGTDGVFYPIGTSLSATATTAQVQSGTMRDAGCDELGGYKGFSATPSPVCYFNRAYTDNLVDQMHSYQFFGDANLRLNDAVQYHNEFMFRRQNLDVIQGVVDGMNNSPCEPIPAQAPNQGATAATARDCIRMLFGGAVVSAGYSTPGFNPAVADYFGRFYSLAGTSRGVTEAQYEALVGLPSSFSFPTQGPPTGTYALSATPSFNSTGNTALGGRVFFPQLNWQIFGWGGNPAFEDGLEHLQVDNYTFRTVQELKVDLGKVFGATIDFNISGTYQRDMQIYQDSAILVDRLQRALNGFATNLDDPDGDTCTSAETAGNRVYSGTTVTQVPYTVGAGGGANPSDYSSLTGFIAPVTTGVDPPGAAGPPAYAGNGCYFLNPFSTAYGSNPFMGITVPMAAANGYGFVGGPEIGGTAGDYQGYAPGYGLGNAPGIARWLYEDRSRRITTDNVFFDLAFNGDFAGLSLPGGPLGWAAGTQWRYVRRSTDRDRLSDENITPCPFRNHGVTDPVFAGSIAGSVANDQLRREDSSTCSTNDDGPWTDGANGASTYRQVRTVSYFGELAVPFTDRITGQIAYRFEEENQNSVLSGGGGIGIFSGSLKYQLNRNFSVRGSWGDTFDPIAAPDPAVTNNVADNAFGGSIVATDPISGNVGTLNPASQTLSIANVGIGPEEGFNYNVGIIWQTPDRRLFGTIDYFDIEITGESQGLSALNILRALTGIENGNIFVGTPVDCSSPVAQILFNQPQAALDTGSGPRPIIAYRTPGGGIDNTGGCRPGTTLEGHAATGDALSIAFLSQINAGTSRASGIDARLTYAHPEEFLGGRFEVTLDATYNIKRNTEDDFFLGVQIDTADNLLGQLQAVSYNIWRGSVAFNYVRGRHAFSWQTRAFSSLRSTAGTFSLSSAANNYNPADPSLCNPTILPVSAIGGVLPETTTVLGPSGIGEFNYNPACNVPYTESHKLYAKFNSDFTYRLNLPEYRANAFISVFNVFDETPNYWGVTFGYDTSGGIGPLGRQVKVGVNKTF